VVLHCVRHADSNGKICSLNLFSKGGGAQCWLKVDQFLGIGGIHQHTEQNQRSGGARGGHSPEVADTSQDFPHQASRKLNINTLRLSFVHHQHSLSMGQGKFILESTQWIVICLASMMSIEDTAMYSDVSPSSIQRILAHFKETGDVIKSKCSKMQVASTLCDLDIQVWLYLMTKLVVDTLSVHAFCTRFNA